MEYVFEFLLDLLLEGSIEASKSSKIPRYIRYPLIGFIILFFISVIGLIIFTGVLCLNENLLLGICFIVIGILLLIASIIKFYKIYLIKKEK